MRELLEFLTMVKLKEGKIAWALKQEDKKNKDLALLCNIGIRRFQQLKAQYKRTGIIPVLKWNRRQKTMLTKEQLDLIHCAIKESNLTATVALRLHIEKHHGQRIPYGKLHQYLRQRAITKPDPKKQKQRKYCRYQRDHSFSLGHMDFHESRTIPGKQVIVWEDDASRYILAGGEFDHATTEVAKHVTLQAKKNAWEHYCAILRELNTDKGAQFYANKTTLAQQRGIAQFETFLQQEGIKHIPSRRNHPQTNGKQERWFRTYEENRKKFSTFKQFIEWYNNRIHLGLNRKQGITPNEALFHKMPPESLIGLFYRRYD